MARVTSKLQVTIPKAIADQYRLKPGSDITFVPAGDAIRVVPEGRATGPTDPAARLRLFDQASARQRAREGRGKRQPPKSRGWRRDQLYVRGVPRRH